MPQILRPAECTDYTALFNFTNSLSNIHRHLDWRDVMEWLGRQPFWICEDGRRIIAALACPPEPEEVAWVRLFGALIHEPLDSHWQRLFERALEQRRKSEKKPTIASLALREWYERLLERNGFIHYQNIVVFMYNSPPPQPPKIDTSIVLREMDGNDLDAVKVVDNQAFEPIWRLSIDDLRYAFSKSSYCTVAEMDGEVVGYTMSSNSGVYAHLSRLAVHPRLQHQRLGFALVQDLLDHFISKFGYWGVTLNTQDSNSASLALYRKVGFQETGEHFPVFVYPD